MQFLSFCRMSKKSGVGKPFVQGQSHVLNLVSHTLSVFVYSAKLCHHWSCSFLIIVMRIKIQQSFIQGLHCGGEGMKVKSEMKMLVTRLCLTLCDPMDCSPPGSFVRGILQARVLEWVTISFSRGSSRPLCRCILICSITLYVWT